MSQGIHLISNTIPGYGRSDGRCLLCSKTSGAAALSPYSYRLDCTSNNESPVYGSKRTSLTCSANSNNHRRNPDFSRQNRQNYSFSRNKNRSNMEREKSENLDESEYLSSKNGPLLSLSSSPRYQATATPGPREKEMLNYSERKHSVEQGKRRNGSSSGDFPLDQPEQNSTFDEEHNTSFFETNIRAKEESQEPNMNPFRRPPSNFRRKSPVPRVKYQPVYSVEENDSSVSILNSQGKREKDIEEPELVLEPKTQLESELQPDTKTEPDLEPYIASSDVNDEEFDVMSESDSESEAEFSDTDEAYNDKDNDLHAVNKLFQEIVAPDVYSWTTLLSAYIKAGEVDYAIGIFERMPLRNVAVWNAVITGCVEKGEDDIALGMFRRMLRDGVMPDHYTFASVLSSSCCLLDFGRQMHGLVIRSGFLVIVSVVNAQLSMYFKFEMFKEAYEVFEEAKGRTSNQITFNAMIAGLVNLGKDVEALMVFGEMKEVGYERTELTFVSVMSACSSARMMELGQQVHADAIKIGLEGFTLVSNATINMYTNCGNLVSAWLVFELLEEKDLISWNSIIECYSQEHSCRLGIKTYLQMQMVGIKPDEFTIGSLLSCSELGVTEMIQGLVAKNGLILNIQVCNALVCAFSKHGKIERAYQVFAEMSSRNLISWNSIISGCLFNGLPELGLELFSKLQICDIQPNFYTLSIILSTCASISALKIGKQVHGYILRSQFNSETTLENALITMYARCGVLVWSSNVFRAMNEKDVISWNSMIAAYAQHGEGCEAIHCFESMQESGVTKPDQATFTAVLSACSHAGLVKEGRQIFSSMVKDHKIKPGMDHFSCITDLLGRAGHLDEAESLINTMPFRPDSTIWWALLSSCISYANVRLGKVAAGYLQESEPDSSAIYVLLSNLHAAAGQWEEAATVRELMLNNRVLKQPGCSWI
ncbi:hypothetical protein IFM89_003571 [Coptis chinensis]|uniref:Pentatricopeptide repeat-containing protein n=1 Tax=Coptis chinensis TaxID=261450 RepID=A0A835LWT0_9MAGN|nr:hypothetical protein IFM89_003571 [Coptis chinensis]